MKFQKFKVTTVNVDEDTWSWVARKAHAEKRSISGQVRYELEALRKREESAANGSVGVYQGAAHDSNKKLG